MSRKSISNFVKEIKAFAGDALNLVIKDGVGELTIYDYIDPYWGISADSVVKALAGQELTKLIVRVNSPGGDVFEGIAIYNFLRSRSYPVETINDGWAASIASIILMAGSVVKSSARAMIMIHDPWCMAGGNAKELRACADLLDKTGNELRQIYITKSGIPEADVTFMMAEETWLTAQEALDLKLVDEITGEASSEGDVMQNSLSKHKVAKALYNRTPDFPEVKNNVEDKPLEKSNADISRAKAKALNALAAIT